jgi:hypothetical protein
MWQLAKIRILSAFFSRLPKNQDQRGLGAQRTEQERT